MKRRFFRLWDLVLLFAVLIAVLLLVLRPRKAGETAYIYADGVLYAAVSLSDPPGETYILSTARGVLTLAFAEGGVSVVSSDCRDDVCVRTGRISRVGESIVCAPLGVCVTVGESTYDGVTG